MTVLEHLKDRENLRETVMKFALAVDTLDMDLYRAVFAEECDYDVSSVGGPPPVVAKVANWAAGIEPFLRGFDATQHLLSNLAFEITGDDAVVTAYVQAEHFLANEDGDGSVTLGGNYTFRLIRTGNRWRINGFKLVAAWHRGNQALYALAGQGSARR